MLDRAREGCVDGWASGRSVAPLGLACSFVYVTAGETLRVCAGGYITWPRWGLFADLRAAFAKSFSGFGGFVAASEVAGYWSSCGEWPVEVRTPRRGKPMWWSVRHRSYFVEGGRRVDMVNRWVAAGVFAWVWVWTIR